MAPPSHEGFPRVTCLRHALPKQPPRCPAARFQCGDIGYGRIAMSESRISTRALWIVAGLVTVASALVVLAVRPGGMPSSSGRGHLTRRATETRSALPARPISNQVAVARSAKTRTPPGHVRTGGTARNARARRRLVTRQSGRSTARGSTRVASRSGTSVRTLSPIPHSPARATGLGVSVATTPTAPQPTVVPNGHGGVGTAAPETTSTQAATTTTTATKSVAATVTTTTQPRGHGHGHGDGHGRDDKAEKRKPECSGPLLLRSHEDARCRGPSAPRPHDP
jgi:hypothetical protein